MAKVRNLHDYKKPQWAKTGGHEESYARRLGYRQIRFVEEFLIDANVTRAAERAGYTSPHLSGPALMKDVRIKRLLAHKLDERSQRLGVTADRVLMELQFAAYFDPADFIMHKVQTVDDIANLPPDVRRCIRGWKYDKAGRLMVEFIDKMQALDALGRHLGLFREVLEVNVVDHASAMDRAKKRAMMAVIEGTAKPVDSLAQRMEQKKQAVNE